MPRPVVSTAEALRASGPTEPRRRPLVVVEGRVPQSDDALEDDVVARPRQRLPRVLQLPLLKTCLLGLGQGRRDLVGPAPVLGGAELPARDVLAVLDRQCALRLLQQGVLGNPLLAVLHGHAELRDGQVRHAALELRAGQRVPQGRQHRLREGGLLGQLDCLPRLLDGGILLGLLHRRHRRLPPLDLQDGLRRGELRILQAGPVAGDDRQLQVPDPAGRPGLGHGLAGLVLGLLLLEDAVGLLELVLRQPRGLRLRNGVAHQLGLPDGLLRGQGGREAHAGGRAPLLQVQRRSEVPELHDEPGGLALLRGGPQLLQPPVGQGLRDLLPRLGLALLLLQQLLVRLELLLGELHLDPVLNGLLVRLEVDLRAPGVQLVELQPGADLQHVVEHLGRHEHLQRREPGLVGLAEGRPKLRDAAALGGPLELLAGGDLPVLGGEHGQEAPHLLRPEVHAPGEVHGVPELVGLGLLAEGRQALPRDDPPLLQLQGLGRLLQREAGEAHALAQLDGLLEPLDVPAEDRVLDDEARGGLPRVLDEPPRLLEDLDLKLRRLPLPQGRLELPQDEALGRLGDRRSRREVALLLPQHDLRPLQVLGIEPQGAAVLDGGAQLHELLLLTVLLPQHRVLDAPPGSVLLLLRVELHSPTLHNVLLLQEPDVEALRERRQELRLLLRHEEVHRAELAAHGLVDGVPRGHPLLVHPQHPARPLHVGVL
mmetsp:Transcript_7880/g.23359  ORF Transcript_7880/g.23359 Transcript_7880/m.23359 type:complete len:711 (+) Transcript_7880:33-2165(+)